MSSKKRIEHLSVSQNKMPTDPNYVNTWDRYGKLSNMGRGCRRGGPVQRYSVTMDTALPSVRHNRKKERKATRETIRNMNGRVKKERVHVDDPLIQVIVTETTPEVSSSSFAIQQISPPTPIEPPVVVDEVWTVDDPLEVSNEAWADAMVECVCEAVGV